MCAWFKIIHGDSLEEIPQLPKIDCVFTSPDPPNYNKIGISQANNYPILLGEILMELKPKLKDTGSLWLHRNEVLVENSLGGLPEFVCMLMQQGGWELIHKIAWIAGTDEDHRYDGRLDPDWQPIYQFAKSDRPFFRKFEQSSVWYGKWGNGFPESPINKAIHCTTNPGDLVCDPFCGGGTTGVVALKNDRNFIGIDLDKENVNISIGRLKKYGTMI
jgi:DNA modification methylase